MRLIDTAATRLVQVVNPPSRYAILSHTWEDGEVLFEDFTRGGDIERSAVYDKKGHAKFLGAVKLAREAGFEYIWIDNCCIDKSSSAELSEAINSMFKWYQKSTICFVYLGDYSEQQPIKTIGTSRWFRRSWTLQELIAPKNVQFYSREWTYIGAKDDLRFRRLLVKHTRIPARVLSEPRSFRLASVAQRMSWAADREATREEDCSYSLFGIFEVNMAPLYGEGRERSFRRLQEEIIRTNSDDSILVWEALPTVDPGGDFPGEKILTALAPSLACFRHADDVVHFFPQWKTKGEHMSVTPWGIRMEVPIIKVSERSTWAVLSSRRLGSFEHFGIEMYHAGRPGQLSTEAEVYQRVSSRPLLFLPETTNMLNAPPCKLQLINDARFFLAPRATAPNLHIGLLDPLLHVAAARPPVAPPQNSGSINTIALGLLWNRTYNTQLTMTSVLVVPSTHSYGSPFPPSVTFHNIVIVSARPIHDGVTMSKEWNISVMAYTTKKKLTPDKLLSQAWQLKVPESSFVPFSAERNSKTSSRGLSFDGKLSLTRGCKVQAELTIGDFGTDGVCDLELNIKLVN